MRRVRPLVEVDGKEREMEFLTQQSLLERQQSVSLPLANRSVPQTNQAELAVCAISTGNSANAVPWQVWTALLLNVLMRFLCVTSRWNHYFNRLFTLLRATLWRKIDLWDLLRLDSVG